MKAETLKKPCVKFEAHRLKTLRKNSICKKVNQNVNQERAVRPDNPILITGLFLRKTRLKKGYNAQYASYFISCSQLIIHECSCKIHTTTISINVLKFQTAVASHKSLDEHGRKTI